MKRTKQAEFVKIHYYKEKWLNGKKHTASVKIRGSDEGRVWHKLRKQVDEADVIINMIIS